VRDRVETDRQRRAKKKRERLRDVGIEIVDEHKLEQLILVMRIKANVSKCLSDAFDALLRPQKDRRVGRERQFFLGELKNEMR